MPELDLPPTSFEVTFELESGETKIAIGVDEFILPAARRAGLDLPSLCEQGWCITCAVWVRRGMIDQSASRRFFSEDRAAGFGLICTGCPRSDLTLRPGATEAMRAHRLEQRLPVPRGTTNRIAAGRSTELP